MDIIELFNKKIEKILLQHNPLCILLIGKAAKIEKKDWKQLKDIDLFVIVDKNLDFEREVCKWEEVDFDISYLSLETLKKGIVKKWPFFIHSLHHYKIIYNKRKEIENFLDEIQHIYLRGPKPLQLQEIHYIRFQLSQAYEDIIARKNDPLICLFLMNNLFKDLLVSYFKLNHLWIPKDKKMLTELQRKNPKLYHLSQEFLKQETLIQKQDILLEILHNVLKPFGGKKKYWKKGKFPLK
ncbi:hypothetical protein [Garciella nitratireducens]|uniref:hypothetical protein n=1 Tax=Garciella nitratireducens TaxID=218205 RepID=UPI000DE84F58|nr:hypothetical protein [Garciella nitratireducens]RBP37045.1 hypothetical protein DFR81_12612 [Garciella nitratireducens]